MTLSPNIVYLVNTTASSTLILTLPTAPQTGDTVRVVDVRGPLSYNTSLVLRTAESSGTKIQGDATGTLLGDRLTPYPSGELVVQTPNAAFTLVYLGGTDSNGQVGIPTAVQGWWLWRSDKWQITTDQSNRAVPMGQLPWWVHLVHLLY